MCAHSDCGQIHFTDSVIKFMAEAEMQLAQPTIKLINNSFGGDGTVMIGDGKGLGVDQATILINRFDGVKLQFGNISSSQVVLRNNDGTVLQSTGGVFKHCDAAGTGLNSGCDVRAQCSEPMHE